MVGEPHLNFWYAYISNEDAKAGKFQRKYDNIWGWDAESALTEVLKYQPPRSGAYLVEILEIKGEKRKVVAKYDPHGLTDIIKECVEKEKW